jgi:ElaB/YqjD/DUF883 family membrane-anchored ribosome-binding protein
METETNRSREEVVRDVEQTRAEAKRAFRNAGEVWSGRNAVASAWRSTKRTYWRTHDKIADTAYAADTTVRENVYPSVGVALSIGAVLGYFLTSKPTKKRKC